MIRRTIWNHWPTAILTSDIEIRDYSPVCRTDDFLEAQIDKLKFIQGLQKRYGGIPVLDGGDLLDKRYRSHPNYYVLVVADRYLPDPFITIPGNHDLPQHEIANYPRSGMAVLESVGRIQVAGPERPILLHNANTVDSNLNVWGFPYRLPTKAPKVGRERLQYNVALVHAMVFQGKEPYPGAEGFQARSLIRLFKGFDLIVCGHNHQSFIETHENQILVNPGSLMRSDANQISYRPRVFLWYAEEARIEAVDVPVREGVVSRQHIEKKEVIDNRLDAFISALSFDGSRENEVSFKKTVAHALASKEVTDDVRQKTKEYCEG
jgi:DNA repair exonuclease SbcCD nuclease subunit